MVENDTLLEQERILNRIGGKAAPAGAAAAPPPPIAQPAATVQAPGGQPIDLSALSTGLDAIRGAIDSMSGAVTAAQHETTGAVRNVSQRLVGA